MNSRALLPLLAFAALFAGAPVFAQAATFSASASAGAVSVRFAEPARLFGLYPITAPAVASIDVSGRVTLSHPWYFLFATPEVNEHALAATLSVEAAAIFNRAPSRAAIGATSTARGRVALSASEAQSLLSGIELALSALLPAEAPRAATTSLAAN